MSLARLVTAACDYADAYNRLAQDDGFSDSYADKRVAKTAAQAELMDAVHQFRIFENNIQAELEAWHNPSTPED